MPAKYGLAPMTRRPKPGAPVIMKIGACQAQMNHNHWTPCENPETFPYDDPLLWLDMEIADLAGDYSSDDASPDDRIRLATLDVVQQMIKCARLRWRV